MWPCGEQRTLTCHGSNTAFSDWLASEKEILITLNNLVPDLPLHQTSDQTEEETLQWQHGVLQKDYFTVLFRTFCPDDLRQHLRRPRRTCLESWFGSHFRDALLGFDRDQETPPEFFYSSPLCLHHASQSAAPTARCQSAPHLNLRLLDFDIQRSFVPIDKAVFNHPVVLYLGPYVDSDNSYWMSEVLQLEDD